MLPFHSVGQVVEIGEDDGTGRGPKIGCSIKLVDQTSGEDMDPNGLRYKPRGSGPGETGRQLGLGASAGNVVGGKIDWGHLAGDNRLYAGDHTGQYKMLEDDGKPQPGNRMTQQLPPPPPLPLPHPPALGMSAASIMCTCYTCQGKLYLKSPTIFRSWRCSSHSGGGACHH